MVRGYQNIWDAACDGELLNCDLKGTEPGNPRDPSAVAVMKGLKSSVRSKYNRWTCFMRKDNLFTGFERCDRINFTVFDRMHRL